MFYLPPSCKQPAVTNDSLCALPRPGSIPHVAIITCPKIHFIGQFTSPSSRQLFPKRSLWQFCITTRRRAEITYGHGPPHLFDRDKHSDRSILESPIRYWTEMAIKISVVVMQSPFVNQLIGSALITVFLKLQFGDLQRFLAVSHTVFFTSHSTMTCNKNELT
jgi:hypothetical protein